MFNPIFKGKISKSDSDKSDNKFFIQGYMSKPVVDLENEIVDTSAYDDAIDTVQQRSAVGRPIPIFIEHRRKELSLPVGKIVDAGKDDKGLWFKGEIAGGVIGQPVRDLIKGGYLYGCSIGGDALKTIPFYDSKSRKDVRKITKMAFRELSLTGLPVNEEAVFSIAKSLNKDGREVKLLMNKLNKAIDMQQTLKTLEKAVEPDNLDEASLNRIKEALNNLAKLLKIDIAEGGGVTGEGATPVEGAETPTPEAQPAADTTAAPEPAVAEQAPSEVETTEIEEKKKKPEEEVKLKTPGTPEEGSKLDEINSKLDKLLSMEATEEESKYSEEDNSEDNDSEENDSDEDNDSDDDENGKKKKFPKKKDDEERGDNMEYLKCRKCGAKYDITKSYDAKYCPECGEELEADQSTEKALDTEGLFSGDDLICEECGSVFGKSEKYEAHYCPKCGKSLATIAVAPPAKGADTKRPAEKQMPKGNASPEGGDRVAVAPSPKGADTSYQDPSNSDGSGMDWKTPDKDIDNLSKGENADGMEKDLSIDKPVKDNANNVASYKGTYYVPADQKEVTDRKGSDLNESRPAGKPMLGADNPDKYTQYGKDRMGKSMDERLSSIEKTIEKVLDKSEGRKSEIPGEGIEKSQTASVPSQESMDRNFAQYLLGSKK